MVLRGCRLAVAVLASTVTGAAAQAVPAAPDTTVSAQVIQIAGAVVYVGVGTGAGLAEGDTVWVRRADGTDDERPMIVVSSSRRSTALTFAAAPMPVTRGERLALRIGGSAPLAVTPARETEATVARRPPPTLGTGPRIDGRISMDVQALRSTTRYDSEAPSTTRTFVTPTSRLQLRVSDLPGGLSLRTSLRGSYRYDANGIVDPAQSVRVYELAAHKRFQAVPVELQMGRFYNPYDQFSGYWDGLLVRVGGDGLGVGGVVGLEPDRWNEAFSADRPKFSVFMDFRRSGQRGGTRGSFSVQHVRPSSEFVEHTYAGWSQSFWWNGANLAHSIQIDRDPESNRWVVSDLFLNGSVGLGRGLRLRARWSNRRPFYYWRASPDVFSYRRNSVAGGMSWSWAGGSLAADLTGHTSDVAQGWSLSSAGTVRLHSIGVAGLGLTVTGTHGSFDRTSITSLATTLDRRVGTTSLRGGYRVYRSASPFHEILSHNLDGYLTTPLMDNLRLTVQLSTQLNRNLLANRAYLSLTRTF